MEKYSRQRQEILDFLIESYDHPTAEEVYKEVKERGSTASKGTVYRNLNFLVEKGIIEKVSMSNGADRYDYKKTPHNHAICVKCNTVFDFECAICGFWCITLTAIIYYHNFIDNASTFLKFLKLFFLSNRNMR